MKGKKIGLLFIVMLTPALLILGISNALAGEPPDRSNFMRTLSPTGGGGPGAVDNWFTYQGYLEDGSAPVSDTCDFEFSLWDSSGSGEPPTGGNQIGITESILALPVSEGLFSYPLNASGSFGNDAFNGQRRYLQIAVRCPAGGGSYTTLAPRQLLTASPYALSLRPGAVISANQNNPLLTVINSHYTGTLGSAVEGRSTNSTGVYGFTSSIGGTGVTGVQSGYAIGDLGGYWKPGGFFGGRNGVVGLTKANSGYGVVGWDQSSAGGWAGFFLSTNGNGVYISAPNPNAGLNVAGGTKNAVVRTDGGSRLMYSEEATEVWFSDYGFGTLQNGSVVITIDPIFAQTVNLSEPYHVFLQAYGDAGLYVTNRTVESFEIHLREGDPNVEFSYRIVAPRLYYEDTRMEPAPWADNDPNLYPEKAGEAFMSPQGGQ